MAVTVKPASTRWSARPSTSGVMPGISGSSTTPGPEPRVNSVWVIPALVKGSEAPGELGAVGGGEPAEQLGGVGGPGVVDLLLPPAARGGGGEHPRPPVG